MNRRCSKLNGTVAALLLTAVGAAAAGAQPAAQPGGGERERVRGGGTQQPTDAKGLRQLIEQRLEDHRQGVKRLEEALKRLEAGGDPAVIGKELLDAARENRRVGGNRGGGDEQGGVGAAGGSGTGAARSMSGGNRYELAMIGGPKLNAEDRAFAYKLLEEKHPELLRRVVALAGDNPETVTRFKDGVGGRLRWLESVREKDPEEARLRLEELTTGLDLIKLGREVTDAKKKGTFDGDAALRTRLRDAMATQFDTRQQLSKLLLRQLRERAERQEKEIAEKDSNRDAMIAQRTEDFLRMTEGKGKKGDKTEPEATPVRKP
ncbi:MAG TPA: hypothetical protein VEB22_09345 [Phycisphaerales bacterium]|nr:hypothetical protein [Phycisphaerales bacterium]